MRQSGVRCIRYSQVTQLISIPQAIEVARKAYIEMADGRTVQPDVMYFDLGDSGGEVHAKGGHIVGTSYFTIKVASGFPGNPLRGLPVTGGLVLVFSAVNGLLNTMIFDNGFLTQLRTAAAGAMAADLLARPEVTQIGLIGAGEHASLQLDAILSVRDPKRVRVWNRTPERAERLVEEAACRLDADIKAAPAVEDMVRNSDLLISLTAATEPVICDAWVGLGTHINAIGSDTPTKNEIDPEIFRRARLVVDSFKQCLTQGELRSAALAGAIDISSTIPHIGEVAIGRRHGRISDRDITICDMTGVGALDTAIASFVVDRAAAENVGEFINMSD